MRTLEPGCFEVLTRSGSRCLVRAKWPVWFDCEKVRLARFQRSCLSRKRFRLKERSTHELHLDAVLELVRPRHDTGIVDEDVEARDLVRDRVRGLLRARDVGQVERDKDEVVRLARSRLVDALDCVLRLFLVAAEEKDLATLLVELPRRDEADPFICARYGSDLQTGDTS